MIKILFDVKKKKKQEFAFANVSELCASFGEKIEFGNFWREKRERVCS